MTGAEFKSTVEYYGEANVMGILFDNSSVKLFSEGEFTMALSYIEPIESLQFVEYDNKGRPYHVVKHVENIQGFVIKDAGVAYEEYDRISLRG